MNLQRLETLVRKKILKAIDDSIDLLNKICR